MPASRIISRLRLPSEKEISLFLLRFYLVATVGFMLPISRAFFTALIPFALLFSLILLLAYELTATRKRGVGYFLVFAMVVYVISFVVEMVGVNTGVLFGHYRYESSLGIKVAHTPLMIGVNWVLLTLGAASISTGISSFMGFSGTRYIEGIFRVITGAFLMVSIDFILERVAPWMDMWSWLTPRVPGRNYLMWLLLSLLFQTYYVVAKIQQRSRIAATLFVLQFFFFLLLFLYIRFI